MANLKLYVGLGLLMMVVLFSIQNAESLEVSFLFWTFTMRRAVVLFLVLAIGIVLGWASHAHYAGRIRRERGEP